MTRIILEKHYGDRIHPQTLKVTKNAYLGMTVVDTKELTPDFLAALKADKDDKQGWKKHHKKLKEHGYDVESA